MGAEITKREVASAFRELALLLELTGGHPQQVRAYENAARTVERSPADLGRLVRENRLRQLGGIGKAVEEKIRLIYNQGHLPGLEELRRRFPASLSELFSVPGLDPGRIKALYEELGVDSIVALEQACEHNRVALLKGFGPAVQDHILEGLEFAKAHKGARLLHRVYGAAKALRERLLQAPGLMRLDVAGSLRRGRELIRDIDLVACTRDPGALIRMLLETPGLREAGQWNGSHVRVVLESGIPVELHICPEAEYPFVLLHLTGNPEHVRELGARLGKRGLRLTPGGLLQADGRAVRCADEAGIYAAAGLPYVPPELREYRGEFSLKQTPVLAGMRDLRGIIHCHTTYSDGLHTMVEMVSAAQGKGFSYLVVSDHSQTASYAGGLTPRQVAEQHEEIDLINTTLLGFWVLKGIESDILPDGSLDYEEEVLRTFDLVIASVHSGFDMTEEEATRRIIRAVENPYTNIIGHPTGRLLLSRKGYPLNIEKVFDACAANRTAIEINANCRRLDLDWRLLHLGKRKGVRFSIGPDAHSTDRLDFVPYGLGMARKGWLAPRDLLNALSAEDLVAWCRAKRP